MPASVSIRQTGTKRIALEAVLARRIFDGEALTELLGPLELGWKARAQKEGELMAELAPLLRKRAGGREIAGLKAWEEAR